MKETPQMSRNSNPEQDVNPTKERRLNSQDSENDDLEFVVTEAHDQNTQLVGAYDSNNNTEDDLGIETNADLMEQEAHEGRSDFEPSGISEKLETDDLSGSGLTPSADSSHHRDQDALQTGADILSSPEPPDRIEKLSDDRVREISKRMNGGKEPSQYLTEEEKVKLLKNLNNADNADNADEESTEGSSAPKGFDNSPIVPPKKNQQPPDPQAASEISNWDTQKVRPKMAPRTRGVAYFAKKFIQITGEQELHDQDEIIVNGREYVLRPKKLSNKVIFGILTPVLVFVAFILAAWLSSGSGTGEGRIVGFALDANDQPFITGAEIRFPQIGRTYQTNAQGFFKSDAIEPGSQKIEYVVAGMTIGTDYATVVDGKITTISLRPSETESAEVEFEEEAPPTRISQAPPSEPRASEPVKSTKAKSEPAKKKSSSSDSKTASKLAKLRLVADVKDAKLIIDGSVMGAGNLTYTKLSPGTHTYEVSKEGYQTAEGKVKLTAGQTEELTISLKPVEIQTNPEKDLYTSGTEKYGQADYTSAINDFNQALTLDPTYAEAYLKRADAYSAIKEKDKACTDYLKAGELFSTRKNTNPGITAYTRAIDLEPRLLEAYLGRGYLYLSRNEEIAAIADFDMAIRLDKRNLQAYLGLGQARYLQGYYKKAIKHFKDARSLDPENPNVYQYLMLSYMEQGDTKEVNNYYEKFLKYASQEQARRMKTDPQFSAVMEIVED